MTSVEKRRSGRKSGGHRKHSDGGYSDTSSGGSFLDETDREVSSLTDRAFRSLCIGDEAVYNDSDLCSSSPCSQRDRQLAFSQSVQDRDREDREREELKRAAHESFSLRMQHYGQDWMHGGMYGAKIHRDPQWQVYGERTQGRVSATFQHSFVETSQQGESLREEQLSFLSNGATELSSQQRRSRSRVSSLIRAFNSEGHRDGAGMDGKLREWNNETNWDNSALMSIQRELNEFSTSYQQNFNSSHFPSAGLFSSGETNFYSSEVAAMAHMNSESSFMKSSHSKHSMSTQVNCNSNFFIHSEFSPFKVWREHNRFPFQQGEVSGFVHCSEFPKWYETSMYRELSLEAQPQVPYRFEERGIRPPRNDLVPVAPPTPSRSNSTSTMLQKALAVEKRCESELVGHYPHRKRTQSLGTNRLPSQRPSTASPTTEMSRRVQDTISSVKALQQKIKMMTEENITTGMTENHQAVHCSSNNLIPYGNKTVVPNVVSSNTTTTPFSISQLLMPLVSAPLEAETSEVPQYAVSPQPVEHPPVRAESRGATPDIRMSSYKSRATSLLFNLKDNRKRVKSTYSPAKFKGLDTNEKNKQPSIREPRDTVIDIPDFSDPDIQFSQVEESSRTNAVSHQYLNQYNSSGLSLATLNSQPATARTGQYLEYTSSDYQPAHRQGEMVHHSGFTGFIPENYASNQLANGQNLREELSSFTPYKQGIEDNVEALGRNLYTFKPPYTATGMPQLSADNSQTREYLISKANTEQHFNETTGREFTKVDRYQQLKDNKHDNSNVSSQDRRRQTSSQDTENLSLKTAISPWKPEITALMEKDQYAQVYERAAQIKEELNLPKDKHRENTRNINKGFEKIELRQSFDVGTSHKNAGSVNPNISKQLPQYAPFSDEAVENAAYYAQQQHGAFKNKYVLQKYGGPNKEREMEDNNLTHNYNRYTDQEYRNQQSVYSNKNNTLLMQETGPRKPVQKGHEMQSLQLLQTKGQFEHNMQQNSLSKPDNACVPTVANQVEHRQFVEVKAEQARAEHIKAQHAQAELAQAQHWSQVEQSKVESARLILVGQTGSEKVKAEQDREELTAHERLNQAKAEHIQDKNRKEEQTKTEQTRVQKVKEEPKNILEETVAKHMREVQGEQVKAEQAEAERLKEEHIKTELSTTEQAGQARIKQAKLEQVTQERFKAEQLEEEQVREEHVKKVQMKAEQIRTGNVKEEQPEPEHKEAEQGKLEHTEERQAKEEEKKDHSVQACQVNAEQPSTQSKAKDEKVEDRRAMQARLEQTKMELAKAELTKTEQERSAKPTAKLTMTQQVKNEPDKVEQVKTELAKAKAELAKIKEKMIGEPKEKVRNTILTKEDGIKRDVPLKVNINKNEAYRDQDQTTQMHQQKRDSVIVIKQNIDQPNRGADDYERLREKYGFKDTTSTNRNKLSAAGNVCSRDNSETKASSADKVETTNNEKSKDKPSSTNRCATANTENREEVSNFKPNEETENNYVYSESSKEFKLSSADYLPTSVDRANSDTATEKVQNESVANLEKCDSLKHADVSQQRGFDLDKPHPLDRKVKSADNSAGPYNDPHVTATRAHKERAQTKQEILTSKIKAHAEKEISAIKERGFAIREGFLSKTSTKQLAGRQSIHMQQRPPSQEVSKKHESTMSSHTTPKHQMEPSGIQMEPVKSISPTSTTTMPVKSAATASQLEDHSKKQVPKEPMKTNDNVTKPQTEPKQTDSNTINTDEVANQRKENQSGIETLVQSKKQTSKNQQGKQETSHGEISRNKKERVPVVNTDHLNKMKDNPSQSSALIEAENSRSTMTEKSESKHEAVCEDSAPSLNLPFGQSETPLEDDSLKIMGITVTVRERKPSVNSEQRNNSTQEQLSAKDKEFSNSELDKCNPISGLEVSEGNESSKEVSRVKATERVLQNSNSPEKEDHARVDINNHPENLQETSTLEPRQRNISGNATMEKTNLQQVSSTNARPQEETQSQEPLAEKSVPSTVPLPAKNKVLAATQPLLNTQDLIARETKDYANKTTEENSARSIRKNEGNKNTDLFKEDMTTLINLSKSRSIDGNNSPLLEEERLGSTPPKPLNKTSPTVHLHENENIHIFPQHQCKEPHIEENSEVDDNVHIGSIAIRVVPAVTKKDNFKMVGKHHVTTVPSDAVSANEDKQVASSSQEEKNDTLNNEDRTKDLIPASSENQMKDSVDDNLGVQLPLKKLPDLLNISNQQNSINTTSENSRAENGKSEKVNKSGKSVDKAKIKTVEEDYFQVQGVIETNRKPQNSANAGDTLDALSEGKELPLFQPNKASISNESHNEGNWIALDQCKMKTVESSSGGLQDENLKRKNRETKDHLFSKHSDGPTERQRNKDEKTEAAQAIHIRKQHTENQSSLSTRERQRSRNPNQTKENMAQEKSEVKPKPKERLSTIPEISAIADYARLKVIVAEDRANTIQEFPPNKKEGFFPLIQTRHSRRPVFTADPQDLSVKEKSLPNKTEVSSKMNKEPKPLVFPITEKEHQRTGMFKLGDKERQEKMHLDAKVNEDVLDTGEKHEQHLKERNKLSAYHLKNQGSDENVSRTDNQRVCQEDQSTQVNNALSQATTSSSGVNRPGNIVSQHLKPNDNSYPHEKTEECSSKAKRMPYLDKNSCPQPTLGQVHNIDESKQTIVRKDEKIENKLAKTGEERPEKLRQERLATQPEETTAKQSSAKQLEEEQAYRTEVEKRDEDMKIKHMIEKSRASLAEEERKAAQREGERRAREREAIAIQIKEKREKQREAERRAGEELKAKQTEEERAAQKEDEMRAKQSKAIRRTKDTEEKRRINIMEEKRMKLREDEEWIKLNEERRREEQQEEKRAAQEEQQRRAAQEQEQQRRAAQEELQRRATQEEQQRRATQEEQQRRAAQVQEQQRRAAQEQEQQRRAAQEELQRRAAQEQEQQRRAAQVQEQQRRATQEEQQRRAAQEEQLRRAAQEELQRRAAQEEQQRRAAQEEQQRRAAQEEQQRRAAQEQEQQRRAAQEEQQRRAAQEEQLRRAAQEELQRRAAQEEKQQRRAAQEEQQRRAAQEELQRRAAQEEKQKRVVQEEEQLRKAAQEEQQRRAAQVQQQRRGVQEEKQRTAAVIEEQQRRAALIEEQQRRASKIEEQRIAKKSEEKIQVDNDEEKTRKQRMEEKNAQLSEEERIKQTQEHKKAEHQTEEQGERQSREEWMRTHRGEEEREAVQKEKTLIKQKVEKQGKEETTGLLEESQATLKKEEKRVTQEQMIAQRENEIRSKKREEEELAANREKEIAAQIEEKKRAAQGMDALQYYAITSTESKRRPRERQLSSPLPSQRRYNPSGLESAEDSHTRPYRPQAPASPAPSLPRSNTSSPALGIKPTMFKVKDNTIRGSSFTKSVKPRFHKNFGEDLQVGSSIGSERGEVEQESMKHSAVSPFHHDIGVNRLAAIKESSTFQPASASQDYSVPLSHHRPYSRRSIALDDDSRSVISNMSEDVESFATSATDLADVRGLYDYERPESACSFSSDVSRSLGKPPAVPPKSEKALRRAKRLTTRRIKKELSKAVEDNPTGIEKPLQEVSSIPSSSSSEVCSSNRNAMASPHFSPPVSLAHAPRLESSLASSHTEHQCSHSSFYASPHATGPISLPAASPHATLPVSLPVASPHTSGPASHLAASKTIADVPSSPTLYHANHPAPVTQYHVESSYLQSYPLTQRKVLQDLGSGQYFVVDVPVQVKTKTFFDPDTGKYVQLNVRESAKSTSQPRPQPQQTYLQPHLQPQIRVKPQQKSLSQDTPAGKPLALYQAYHGYPQSHKPAAINSVPPNRSSAPMTLHQDQQPVRESHSYGYPACEMGQTSEGHHYSPEKTPYMDTVNDKDKTYNTVYNTPGSYESFPECDTNSQLAGSSVCESDNSAHSRYRPRDIITMSELEDFMEMSDW